MKRLIDFYRKKRTHLKLQKKFTHSFAFVGIGNHSLQNLYPVLHYLNVTLKYIVTKTPETARLVDLRSSNTIGTNDLELVLNDKDVTSFFVCADPSSHFKIATKLLQRHKNIFIEKPPCKTLHELDQLIELSKSAGTVCMVGLQKRYAPITAKLKKALRNEKVISYNYFFGVGAYPEGDALTELFIHSLDLLGFIFGSYELLSVVNTDQLDGAIGGSYFLHLKHGNAIGTVEISSNYTWTSSKELLTINASKGVYHMEDQGTLSFQKKPVRILNLPLEKVINFPVETAVLFSSKGMAPVLQNNQIYANGFYDELLNFVQLCEGASADNFSSLEQVRPVYELIDRIKKGHV